MWVEFYPVRNKKMVFDLAEQLMRLKPVKLEKVPKGWKLSIFVGREKMNEEKMAQLVRNGRAI